VPSRECRTWRSRSSSERAKKVCIFGYFGVYRLKYTESMGINPEGTKKFVAVCWVLMLREGSKTKIWFGAVTVSVLFPGDFPWEGPLKTCNGRKFRKGTFPSFSSQCRAEGAVPCLCRCVEPHHSPPRNLGKVPILVPRN
jgi:hypothetical protein